MAISFQILLSIDTSVSFLSATTEGRMLNGTDFVVVPQNPLLGIFHIAFSQD